MRKQANSTNEHTCFVCDRRYTWGQSDARTNRAVFCSRRCEAPYVSIVEPYMETRRAEWRKVLGPYVNL